MSSVETCPKCSYPVPEGAIDCPACGIVYAKYRSVREEPPASEVFAGAGGATATVADGDLFNPYAPPKSDLWEPRAPADAAAAEGLWRAGRHLVMSKDAVLPHRCIRCNRPAAVRLDRKLQWHRPLVYLALLMNLIVYVIIAVIARKKARIEVSLCDGHDRARKTWMMVGWAIILGALVLFTAGVAGNGLEVLALLAPLLILVGIVIVLFGSQPILPKRIDDHHVWLRNVSPEMLAELPDAPRHLVI